MIVTAALAAVILAAGVLLLPVVYAGIFDAEKIVYEEEAPAEELLTAPALFMDRFRYPMGEETESISEETREIHVDYFRSVQGPELYGKAFGLAGLEEEEHYWDNLAAAKGEEFFLLQTQAEKGGEPCFLSAAMNQELIPFLICCKSSREPSEGEVLEAAAALQELCTTGTDSLRFYVEEIDGIYENCGEYRNGVRELYLSLLQEKGAGKEEEPTEEGTAPTKEEEPVQEIGERVPLWDCCVRGEWQVCADEGEAVLVCVMGQGDLVLYYDAAAGELCGYRIRFAALPWT